MDPLVFADSFGAFAVASRSIRQGPLDSNDWSRIASNFGKRHESSPIQLRRGAVGGLGYCGKRR